MKESETSKKKGLKVTLSVNGRSASFKLGCPNSMEALQEVIQMLWRTMEEPRIEAGREIPQVNIDPDFLRSQEVLDNIGEFACPFYRNDNKECPHYLINGKCVFGRHTSEQVAVAPQCPVAKEYSEGVGK